jgi:hypothetical protein
MGGKNRQFLQAPPETKKQLNKKGDNLALIAEDIKLDKIGLKEIKEKLAEHFAKYRE